MFACKKCGASYNPDLFRVLLRIDDQEFGPYQSFLCRDCARKEAHAEIIRNPDLPVEAETAVKK